MPKAETAAESEWITKEEAAKLLDVNPRQVQQRAMQGYLRRKLLPRLAHERQARVTYARTDVDALLTGTPNQHGEPVKREDWDGAISQKSDAAGNGKSLARVPAPPPGFGMDLTALETIMGRPTPFEKPWLAYAGKQWLTLDEAAAYSGLLEDTLVSLVRGGYLRAIDREGQDVSPTTQRRSYRVSRASLDAYGEAKP